MKKMLFLFVMLLAFLPTFATNSVTFANEEKIEYFVTANSACLFEEADFSSTKLKTIKHKTVINLELQNALPVEYPSEGFVFYKVLDFEGIDGYIFSDLVTLKNLTIENIPNFNAKTNAKTKVFFKENEKFVESEISLEKGEKIFLYEGYTKKMEFTAISFIFDNELYYGYLKTQDISPNGINPLIISAICVILAVLGIIFAWLFMKKKKKVKIKTKKI